MFRRSVLVALLALSLPVLAQQQPKLEPLPVAPPAPPGVQDEAVSERPIHLTPGLAEQVEESFVDGKRVLRVTTPDGLVYYLREDLEAPDVRRNNILPGIRIPLWVLKEF